jgi:hypothetical protein
MNCRKQALRSLGICARLLAFPNHFIMMFSFFSSNNLALGTNQGIAVRRTSMSVERDGTLMHLLKFLFFPLDDSVFFVICASFCKHFFATHTLRIAR